MDLRDPIGQRYSLVCDTFLQMINQFQLPRLSSARMSSVYVWPHERAGLDLAACVERVRQRDEDAARSLMRHLYPLVLKLVRAHLPNARRGDLVQMVFVKVFAKLDEFEGAAPLEHWVSRIAINTCINQIKAERVRPELRWTDLSDEERSWLKLWRRRNELDATDALAAREIVERLLARLEPVERVLMTLLHLEGRSARKSRR